MGWVIAAGVGGAVVGGLGVGAYVWYQIAKGMSRW